MKKRYRIYFRDGNATIVDVELFDTSKIYLKLTAYAHGGVTFDELP
jgi:hypothetical protein